MWRDETSVVRDERRARRVLPGRLFGQDVEIRRRESVVVERGEERALVDDGASCGIDKTTCVEIKILRRVRAESPRRPPRYRRDACSMAWRCRFLAARTSQDSRAIAAR
jgi:hypothetical protein